LEKDLGFYISTLSSNILISISHFYEIIAMNNLRSYCFFHGSFGDGNLVTIPLRDALARPEQRE
jgi:hypothetical protein